MQSENYKYVVFVINLFSKRWKMQQLIKVYKKKLLYFSYNIKEKKLSKKKENINRLCGSEEKRTSISSVLACGLKTVASLLKSITL